jgi:hypothetical protein
MLIASLVVVALLFGAFVLPYIARRFADVARNRLALAETFYKYAPSLVADERISDSMASVLKGISDDIDSPRVARRLFISWLRGDLCDRDCRSCEFRERRSNSEIAKLPDDLRDKFLTTLATGIICLTYSAPISGYIVRRLLFRPVGMPQRTQDAAHFAAALEDRRFCCPA